MGRLQGHSASILQLLVLGERLLSLGADRRLLVWAVGEFGAAEVRVPDCHHSLTQRLYFQLLTLAGCTSWYAWHTAFSIPSGMWA